MSNTHSANQFTARFSPIAALVCLVTAVAGITFVLIPLSAVAQLVVGGLFLAIAIALNRFQHRTATLAMVMLSMFASARYLVWRITQTIELSWTADMPTTVMASLLLFAECYTFFVKDKISKWSTKK